MHYHRARSPEEHLQAIQSRGRASGTAGSWVSDLAALGKCIVLCGMCAHKFDARGNGYEHRRVSPVHNYIIGDCDGCKNPNTRCVMFLKKED